jgi:hypothetical protein
MITHCVKQMCVFRGADYCRYDDFGAGAVSAGEDTVGTGSWCWQQKYASGIRCKV